MAKKAGGVARNGLRPWTVMVFMVGDPELQSSIDRDLMELGRAGSSSDVSVVVAVQRTSDQLMQWFEIAPRSDAGPRLNPLPECPAAPQGDLDEKLDAFLHFVATDPRFQAQHHLLTLWGHASGLGFGGLGPGSAEDIVRLDELSQSLRQFRRERDGSKLDILGFCACAVSKAEFALELQDEVAFLVSSQVGISTLMTWPFDRIVQRALTSPGVEPQAMASQIVRCFEESYEPPPVALTALDLGQSEPLGKHVDGVSKAILTALDKPDEEGLLNALCVLRAFQHAEDAYPFEIESLVDFFDFCTKLVEEHDLDEQVRDRARSVLNEGARAFVVENARSGPKMAALNGLSILAPDFDDPKWGAVCDKCAPESGARLWKSTTWAKMARRIHEFAMEHKRLLN